MLNSGQKFRDLRDKKKYSNSRVVRNFFSERNKKPAYECVWVFHYLIIFFCGSWFIFHSVFFKHSGGGMEIVCDVIVEHQE